MLTLFTVAKPFRGEFAVIQRNAIRSWACLRPACEILLIGDEEGLREFAEEIGAVHLPRVERNEFGTPLVSSIFSEAQKRASHPILCYINADILLLSDFLPAVATVFRQNSKFLVVGQRTNLKVRALLDFSSGWEEKFRERIKDEGVLEAPNGLDYFVFPRGLWGAIPPFAIGRPLYDNWLIFRARLLDAPVVDATRCLTAVHQNHAYSYHPGGGKYNAAETRQNYALGGGLRNGYTLRDATHRLTPTGIRRRFLPYDLHRCLVVPVITQKWARPLIWLKKALVSDSRPATSEETQ